MAIEFVCPGCGTASRTAKELPSGAQVRCPSCKLVFAVSVPPAVAAPPAPTRPRTSVTRDVPAPPPAPPSKPKATLIREGTGSRPPARPARQDDDDRPRRRRPAKQSSNNQMIIIGSIVGVVLLVVVGVVVAIFAFGGKKDTGKEMAAKTEQRRIVDPAPSTYTPAPTKSPEKEKEPEKEPEKKEAGEAPDENQSATSATAPATGGGSVQDVYQYVLKSTVFIVNIMNNGAASGSGEVVDASERLILTNHHVVNGNVELYVFFPIYEGGKLVRERDRYLGDLRRGGRKLGDGALKAEVIASDPKRDLALVRVPKMASGAETISICKSPATPGQNVHSVGSPGASDTLWVYTPGVVRGEPYRKQWTSGGQGEQPLHHDVEVVETTSPTNHGDSGGPLVNDRGELVGVTQGGSGSANAFAIFISADAARKFISEEFQRKFSKVWKPITRSPLRLHGSAAGLDVTALINQLDHKDPKKRASAAESLGEMGPDAKLAIRRLLKSLHDENDLTSRTAAEALTKIGAPGRDDLQDLLGVLSDPKVEVRRYVAEAIGQIGPEAASAAPSLATALTSSEQDERVRVNLARSLGKLGSDAKTAAVPALTKATQDAIKKVRVAAAEALVDILSPPSSDDVPLFLSLMKHKDGEVSSFGARGLAKLGKGAKSALPDLMNTAKNGDPAARRAAIDTLAAISPETKEVLPIYVSAIKESDSGVRQSALAAIAQLTKDLDKEKNKDVIALVVGSLKDSDPTVKKAALAACCKMGPVLGTANVKLVNSMVIELLQDKDTAAQEQGFDAVVSLGPFAKESVNTLINLVQQRDIHYFKNAQSGLIFLKPEDAEYIDKIAKIIGKVGKDAVGPLVTSLRTSNINVGVFVCCCRALGDIGPGARSALQFLGAVSDIFPHPIGDEADHAMRKIRR